MMDIHVWFGGCGLPDDLAGGIQQECAVVIGFSRRGLIAVSAGMLSPYMGDPHRVLVS